MVRSTVIDVDQPETGCTRSSVDEEIEIVERSGNNCLFTRWFNQLIYNRDMCKEYENTHFCYASVEEWGTADCYDKWLAWYVVFERL